MKPRTAEFIAKLEVRMEADRARLQRVIDAWASGDTPDPTDLCDDFMLEQMARTCTAKAEDFSGYERAVPMRLALCHYLREQYARSDKREPVIKLTVIQDAPEGYRPPTIPHREHHQRRRALQ